MELQDRNGRQPLAGNQRFLTRDHYGTWVDMIRRTSRKRESFLKFLFQLIICSGESVSIICTFIFGFVLHPEDPIEFWSAIFLYSCLCLIVGFVNYFNTRDTITRGLPAGRSPSCHRQGWLPFILNFLMVLKPVRYWKEYTSRTEKLRIINEEQLVIGNSTAITERGLRALTELYEETVKESRTELYESFFQSIPMAILQTYFLFQSYQAFHLCNVEDLSRLSSIFFVVVQAARTTSAFDSNKTSYEIALNFLGFYKSHGDHPMEIYSRGMINISEIANLVCHFCTILGRFYTCFYFLAVGLIYTIAYLVSVFLVNLVLVVSLPQSLLDIHENPPFGISNRLSYWADRVINIFANVGTRFNRFSREPVRIINVRVPLVFIQFLHFGIPLAVVYFTSQFFGSAKDKAAFIKSVTVNQNTIANETIEDVLDHCPNVAKWYTAWPIVQNFVNNYLFSIYKSADQSVETFNDVFNLIHLIWLFFYAQILFSCVYAYAEMRMRTYENFPILTAYGFYETLFEKIVSVDVVNCINNPRKVSQLKKIRKMMLLTILKSKAFYKFTTTLGVIPKCNVSNSKVRALARDLTRKETDVENKIQQCLSRDHVFARYFVQINEILVRVGDNEGTANDKKLFLVFMSLFDRKMYLMTSHRIARIFELLEIPKERTGTD